MYNQGGTISDLLKKVERNEYVLPAIQREFEWWPEQICALFDSLLQGYPFGTFLLWDLQKATQQKFQFYDFVRDYHERDAYHCPILSNLPDGKVVAVLDGQQRITSMNIGLRGSYAYKLHGKRWASADSFPTRHLYLDLLKEPRDETGSKYHFDFLTDTPLEVSSTGSMWMRCGMVITHSEDDLIDMLEDCDIQRDDLKTARKTLRHLYRTIHHEPVVTYFEEKQQELDRVLNIFIRMNSGGTQLSYSDLLLSIAVAEWKNLNAREEIHSLVDEMNKVGQQFAFSKDSVLKAGLMLSDIGNVGFRVDNFNSRNMAILEKNWERVKDSLLTTINLISSFGFNSKNLRAESAILPIAYYVHKNGFRDEFVSKSQYAKDRDAIRKWLIKSFLKASGIWGSGLDTLLTAMRDVIKNDDSGSFPDQDIERVMTSKGKTLRFTDEEMDDLAEIGYTDKRTFSLLSLIFPGFDLSKIIHVDHVFPVACFTPARMKAAKIPEKDHAWMIDKKDRLPNLQLLEGTINNEKRKTMPHAWFKRAKPDAKARKQHLDLLEIESLPETLQDFSKFYDSRRSRLRAAIANHLS